MTTPVSTSSARRPTISPRATNCPVPLTEIQRSGWKEAASRGTLMAPRMCASAVRILGPLDRESIRLSIETLIHRHESLHTRLTTVGGVAQQHIDEPKPYQLSTIDLSELSARNQESEAARLVQEFLDQTVDLSTGPLFEARIWRLSSREHVLVLMISHFVSDGMSNGILVRELWTLYKQAARGQPLSLPELPIQYADFAVWQQQTQVAWMKKHESYWHERLYGGRPLTVPADFDSEQALPRSGLTVHFPFGDALSTKLRECARRERTLLPLVVLTAYAIVMSDWCRRNDLLIPFISHGRQGRPELQNVIGYLANPVPLRLTLRQEDTFRSLLNTARVELSASFQHADSGRIAELASKYQSEVFFNWQPTQWIGGRLDHHVILECASAIDRRAGEASVDTSHATLDDQIRTEPFAARSPEVMKFAPTFFNAISGIHMTVAYRKDLMAEQSVTRFADYMLRTAESLTTDPDERITTVTRRMHHAR